MEQLRKVLRLAFVAELVPFLNDQLAEDRMRPNPLFGPDSPDVLGLLNAFCGADDGSDHLIEFVPGVDGEIGYFRSTDACTAEMAQFARQQTVETDRG